VYSPRLQKNKIDRNVLKENEIQNSGRERATERKEGGRGKGERKLKMKKESRKKKIRVRAE